MKEWTRTRRQIAPEVVHVTWTRQGCTAPESALIAREFANESEAPQHAQADEDKTFLRGKECVLREEGCAFTPKTVYRYTPGTVGELRKKKTANGAVVCYDSVCAVPDHDAWAAALIFAMEKDDVLTGLGQYEDGVFDYRNRTEYLYQSNMRIAMPFLLCAEGWGILLDTETAVEFHSKEKKITFLLDTVQAVSYYVLTGKNAAEVVRTLCRLTGPAALLPRWAFGYIQCKERYQSAEELLDVAQEFRKREIPLDCVVEDWKSWPEEEWGQKTPDPERFPDLPGFLKRLHAQQVHFMLSVWPNMQENTLDARAFSARKELLACSNVYNAFSPAARAEYWRQCSAQWMSAGTDALWCDNAEPFSDADWSGAERRTEAARRDAVTELSKHSLPWEQLNTFGLWHARGIYENWRSTNSEKRVCNLTRSVYLSGQRYGVIPWSGDICARWDVLQKQIVEGQKLSLCGMPYWTFDIGGFFTVRDDFKRRGCDSADNPVPLWFWNGNYNLGVEDLGYRELYVRWFEMGAFLPVFRSHGTDTPREPWQFGAPGTPFYDAIVKYIRLRYSLLPYLYSCAAAACREGDVMMRSLLLDFAQDACAVSHTTESFLCGPAFLVRPVTAPMYYEAESRPLTGTDKQCEVYLPADTLWYDWWTGAYEQGGRTVKAEAPLDQIPLFVRAGSIVPLSEPVASAEEHGGTVSELRIYGGADGSFTLYQDAGDGYGYEQGHYAAVRLEYQAAESTLMFHAAQGDFPVQKIFQVHFIEPNGGEKHREISYQREQVVVSL